MSLALNKPKLDNLAGDIWKSAERLRGKFKAYEYQGVILPIIVIRRLECVLQAWREAKRAEVLAKRPALKDKEKELAKVIKELELNPQQCPFSNKTGWTLRKVYEEDHTLLEANFRAYINGFSKNVDNIIEHSNYRATIGLMVKDNRLAPILNQYKELELGLERISPLEMGYIYEELLRRFSEQGGEEAGDHLTPREVIRLMVELLEFPIPDWHISIYDPAGGTGSMLSVSKEHLLDRASTPEEKERIEKFVTVHGQEIFPTNYAIDGILDLEDEYYIDPAQLTKADYPRRGDLLFNWRNGSQYHVGKTAFFDLEGEFAHVSFLLRLHCGHKMYPFFLRSYLGVLKDAGFFSGAKDKVNKTFNSMELNRLRVVIPPINEQKEICREIERRAKEVNDVKAAIATPIATLTAYRKSLIHECVTGQRRISEADLKLRGAHE